MRRTTLGTRLVALTSAVAIAVLTPGFAAGAPASAELASLATTPTGLSRLLTQGTPTDRGIATFADVPTAGQVSALKALGLVVQPMRRLPLALIEGNVAAMQAAVTSGVASDVYPDELLDYLDTESADSMGAAQLRAAGLTGKGVTVGVVDSGCDGTHPDLADHITHNVTLASAEYVNLPPDSSNTIVVPVDQGPYKNTDLGSGHGTHVAGIIAADSTSAPDGSRYGVAPDAELACFAIGLVITTTAVVTAYDYMLDQPGLLGIDVVNNSWGNSYRMYDPRDPVNVATKAVSDLGVTVVFSAGNSGGNETESSTSPFNQAPWVISVAASNVQRKRGVFSSNGLVYDNSQPVTIGTSGSDPQHGGHTAFLGDRIGITGPDVTAPGVGISSSCSSTGTVIGPCPDHGNDTASGTSMSSPHVAGAAAVLLEARPGLTPAQVQRVLEATASAVTVTAANSVVKAPFWQAGYGFVNLDRAVALVQGRNWSKDLDKAAKAADARALAEDGFRISRSDFWTYDAPRVTVAGSDSGTYSAPVGLGTSHLKVVLVHPSPASLAANTASYVVTVKDAQGRVVGQTTESVDNATGTASALIRLADFGSGPGVYTFDVSGEYAVSDPDTLDSDSIMGRMVVLSVTQMSAG
jgi:serine protease AprX